MPPLSASEAISPALERTKQICFRPFNFNRWLKLGIVTLFTGEVATSSCNFGAPGNIPGSHPGPVYTPPHGLGTIMDTIAAIPIILIAFVAVALLIVVVLGISYLWCRFRLTLVDTVLTGDCQIRQSWQKYGDAGRRLFGFYLMLCVIVLASACGLLVLPLLSAARSGVLRQPGGGLAYLLGAGLILLLIFAAIVVIFGIIVIFLKDFVAPVLALEDISIGEAWGRVRGIASADPGAFVVYILLKIVLAIASGIIFGIVFFFGLLVIFIPLVIIAVGIGVALRSQLALLAAFFTSITLGKIALLAVAIIAFIAVISYVLAFISVPAAIFFESYALYFLGSRYEPLRALLIPQPSPAPYPVIPPQATPDFIPPHPGPETV